MAVAVDAAAVRAAVAEYLRAAGMPEVAAALSPTEQSKDLVVSPVSPPGLCPAAEDEAPAPPRAPPHPLALLLAPHATARAAIAQLMRGGDEALQRQFYPAPLPVQAARLALLRALREPMWSTQCDADDARLPAARGADVFSVRAATLCQLVARLTHVCVLTLSTPGESHVRAQNSFTRAFLRQHRSFALSRALLARLLERFLVPRHTVSLEFEHFAAHGVAVHAPGTTLGHRRSASLWQRMCYAVQVRVLSVLALWLRVYPQHFDTVMLEAVGAFLDDCCYRPQAWDDCPSQLAQLAENVRAEVVRAAVADRDRHAVANHTDRSGDARHYVHHAPVSNPSQESSRAVLSFFDAFSMSRVAAALTARDLSLLSDMCEYELLSASRSARIASFVPERGLLALLACGAELCAWAVSAFLHAARSGLKETGAMLQRLVDLMVELLRLNNVHSAVAVIRALRHPLLQRVMRNPIVLAALPPGALRSIERVAEVFALPKLSATATAATAFAAGREAHDAYVNGIPDTDVHPTVPALQNHLRELRYLHAEVPTFLHIPGGALDGAEGIIAVYWRKFMLADEIIERIVTWKEAAAAAANVSRDVECEDAFAQQVAHVVHDPRCLARMANELLSTI